MHLAVHLSVRKKIFLDQIGAISYKHGNYFRDSPPSPRKISEALKIQPCELKKHSLMIAYMFQKYPENFAFQLLIILQ